jgi:hypothetical protein
MKQPFRNSSMYYNDILSYLVTAVLWTDYLFIILISAKCSLSLRQET